MDDKELEIVNFNEPPKVAYNILEMYGENLVVKDYVTDPAIAREKEINGLIKILLTPEKSALLVGAPGIGKTALVEGLAYRIKNGEVPDVLKDYRIFKFNSSSLVGTIESNGRQELIISLLINELKNESKVIVFIDEIHTLIGGKNTGPLDLANMLKPILDRGDAKAIGATTTIEYDTYIIRDRAFLRRFEKLEIAEPTPEMTVKILMGSLPKINKQTGIKFKYNDYVTEQLITSIVDATSEFKRVYGLSAMYPDVSFSVLTAAYSEALFQNRKEVTVLDVYNAIKSSKRIYPDSIFKELTAFRQKFAKLCAEENVVLAPVTLEELNSN